MTCDIFLYLCGHLNNVELNQIVVSVNYMNGKQLNYNHIMDCIALPYVIEFIYRLFYLYYIL